MIRLPAALLFFVVGLVALAPAPAHAQSNSILDRVRERASTQTEERTNQEVDEAVDKTVDCVFNPVECARRKQAAATAPGAAPLGGAAEWYAESQGNRIGPMPQQELVSKVVSGQVTESTLVWREGMSAWTPAGQIAELGDAFKKVPPPLPSQKSGPPPLPTQR